MTDLNKTILQKSSGEIRLNPDEQRRYMGTFRERVLLVLTFDEVILPSFQSYFSVICQELTAKHSPLFLKLSPKLADSLQISFMKTAKEYGILVSIIDEQIADSPFALLFHSNQAINIESISLSDQFPNLLVKESNQKVEEKTGFWKKLFGK